MGRGRSKPVLVEPGDPIDRKQARANHANLLELAYGKLEELLVNCTLAPGRSLSIQDLQDITGLSRTPVHQAVSMLARDTLVIVNPRNGIQIAPIDLARDRLLLELRRDIERFVVRLAAERSGPTQRNQMMHLSRVLRERRATITIDQFNEFDRSIDNLILAAGNEPFVGNALRPLHTIFRRIGFLHQNHIGGEATLHRSVDCHLALTDAIANRRADDAVKASDEIVQFVDAMFDELEARIDPRLLDCSVEPLFTL